ncbi:Conserved_hypothetical protein [Hexamita inflata]|uniref:Uncharacterized protein n=1 Tax=Hexamita inflata TaxID=28002 RepID=A0AA86NR95_9EUKA|nr:Conserved hypothetical protein [Hexamita inflata]CAI9923928.1 Conserved hypothetical protein [Hexamita inflata]
MSSPYFYPEYRAEPAQKIKITSKIDLKLNQFQAQQQTVSYLIDRLKQGLKQIFKPYHEPDEASSEFNFEGVSSISTQNEFSQFDVVKQQTPHNNDIAFSVECEPSDILNSALIQYAQNSFIYLSNKLTTQTPSEPSSIDFQIQIVNEFFAAFRRKLQQVTVLMKQYKISPQTVKTQFHLQFQNILKRKCQFNPQKSPQKAPAQLLTLQEQITALVSNGLSLKLIGSSLPHSDSIRGCFAVLYSVQEHQQVLINLKQTIEDLYQKMFLGFKQEIVHDQYEYQTKPEFNTKFVERVLSQTKVLIFDCCYCLQKLQAQDQVVEFKGQFGSVLQQITPVLNDPDLQQILDLILQQVSSNLMHANITEFVLKLDKPEMKNVLSLVCDFAINGFENEFVVFLMRLLSAELKQKTKQDSRLAAVTCLQIYLFYSGFENNLFELKKALIVSIHKEFRSILKTVEIIQALNTLCFELMELELINQLYPDAIPCKRLRLLAQLLSDEFFQSFSPKQLITALIELCSLYINEKTYLDLLLTSLTAQYLRFTQLYVNPCDILKLHLNYSIVDEIILKKISKFSEFSELILDLDLLQPFNFKMGKSSDVAALSLVNQKNAELFEMNIQRSEGNFTHKNRIIQFVYFGSSLSTESIISDLKKQIDDEQTFVIVNDFENDHHKVEIEKEQTEPEKIKMEEPQHFQETQSDPITIGIMLQATVTKAVKVQQRIKAKELINWIQCQPQFGECEDEEIKQKIDQLVQQNIIQLAGDEFLWE